jgi:hypothetical protein
MFTKISALLFCFFLSAAGCQKKSTAERGNVSSANSPSALQTVANQEPGPAKFDVCGLIKNEEIQAIQGSSVKETKGSDHSGQEMRISQCFYTTTEFNRSVSLTVTQGDPDSATKRSPKAFWEETFGAYDKEEKEREGDKEKKESLRKEKGKGEEEETIPPKKVTGVGDEAYWSGNRVGGALYVLKNDTFIRISIGGADDQETKINKSKALAQKALDRL